MKKLRTIISKCVMAIVLSLFMAPAAAQSQCGIENKAFKAGEFLAYDLYFNWQFVWVKVGAASMSTVMSTYNGLPCYRTSLTTKGNDKLDGVFVMRDTLTSYCTISDLSPLYYRKGALEGKRYYVDELWYTYPNGFSKVKMHRINRHGEHSWQEKEYQQCVYDMMSIFLRARNFDASTMKKGDVIPLPITDAKHLSDSWMVYRGKENYKVDGTREKFRCLVFSFMEREDGKETELVKFYVTDDQNHMPVRLDLNLSFGSAKVYLRSYQGLRNPLESKLK
ncbi:MAG: DUF3108 domain-containing protein [Prevotella sp.]|nr:DUF3108 domain-containing protein [Prevotella sp.]